MFLVVHAILMFAAQVLTTYSARMWKSQCGDEKLKPLLRIEKLIKIKIIFSISLCMKTFPY